MKLEKAHLRYTGIKCSMWELQASMVAWMLHLARTDPQCTYSAEQGSALSYFIRTYCENNSNMDPVFADDDSN